jgi:hypothetical protein
VTNAMVDSSAAIAGTKISPDFGSQNSVTTGTSTAASFIPTSSTAPTNGVYLPSANNVAISTNGTGRLFVDASGNISIGTSSLTTGAGRTYLTIGGSTLGSIALKNASNAEVLYLQTGAASVDYYMSVAGYQAFWTNNTECMRLDSSGRVGIGTGASTPGGTLEVKAATSVAPFVASGPSSEYARIDSSGRLLVGTSSSRSVGGDGESPIQVSGTNYGGLSIVNNRNDISSAVVVFAKNRSGSTGGSTIVQNGDTLGTLTFAGADGTDLETVGAYISAAVDGTPGANDMPCRLVFSTTADGASSPTERLSIDKAGAVLFKNASFVGPLTDNAITLGASGQRFTAVWAANGTIQTSDGREKTQIANASLGSDFIKSLRPVSYKWIEGGKRDTGERDEDNNYIYESVPGQRTHWGFIAQEVKEAVDAVGVDFGGWVLTDKDDPDSQQALRYDQFIAPITKALQEALTKIETLEAKVAALETA